MMTASQERHMAVLVFCLCYISVALCYWAMLELEMVVHLFDLTFGL